MINLIRSGVSINKERNMAKFTQTTAAIWIAVTAAGLAGCDNTSKAPPPQVSKAPATFTVGGLVSGLSGGGLVLQLNAANDLAVNANGKFGFAKALGNGSPYTVTVKASPAAPIKQTCGVAQGSGSIANAAVNNVAVNCTTNNYAVGGTVSGLAGQGLVLQLNGGNELAIAANGKFIFPGVRMPDGSDYSVAIKATPVKRTCKIEPVTAAFDSDTLNIISVTCAKPLRRR